jgi:hypothetical protein
MAWCLVKLSGNFNFKFTYVTIFTIRLTVMLFHVQNYVVCYVLGFYFLCLCGIVLHAGNHCHGCQLFNPISIRFL